MAGGPEPTGGEVSVSVGASGSTGGTSASTLDPMMFLIGSVLYSWKIDLLGVLPSSQAVYRPGP